MHTQTEDVMIKRLSLVEEFNAQKDTVKADLLKKKIIVLTGGFSEEREASEYSANAVYRSLKEQGFDVTLLDPANTDLVKGLSSPDSIVFNCIHGEFGESGHIPAILDYYKVPYTFSNIYASSIGMDKRLFKAFAAKAGLAVAADSFFNKSSTLKEPLILKSARGGGSIGMKLVSSKGRGKKGFFKEEFIEGSPYSVGVIEGENGRKQVLTPVKIDLKGLPFYNKEAKYGEGLVALSSSSDGEEQILAYAKRLAAKFDFNGAVRFDFLKTEKESYLLEVNTIPGLYKKSNMSISAQGSGLAFDDLLVFLLSRARFYKFGQEKKGVAYAIR